MHNLIIINNTKYKIKKYKQDFINIFNEIIQIFDFAIPAELALIFVKKKHN